MPRSVFLSVLLLLVVVLLAFVALPTTAAATIASDYGNGTLCQRCAPPSIVDNNINGYSSKASCAPGHSLTFPLGQCVNANRAAYKGRHFSSFIVTPDRGNQLFVSIDRCSSGVVVSACEAGSCCAVEGELIVDGVTYGALLIDPR
jgi:hypothetical protein